MNFYILLISVCAIFYEINCKYVEGELHSIDNWAFLARFCFLSNEGLFEYHLEFNEDQGDPNLLLYYDTDDQWPAVYKTNKTCLQREAVLHMDQYQVINLTASLNYYKDSAGCRFVDKKSTTTTTTTPKSKYTMKLPTLPSKIRNVVTTAKPTTTVQTTTKPTDVPYLTTELFYSSDSTFMEDLSYTQTYSTTDDSKLEFEFIEDELATSPRPIKKRAVPRYLPPQKVARHGRTVICQNARSFSSSRERWWFIALSNCNGTKGIHVKYKILMTNGPPGDYWHEHLSADEFYILPILITFSIAYTILLLGIVICSIELKQRQLLHTTYKIFAVSVVFQLGGIMFQSISYLKYAVTGLSSNKIKRLGSVFMGASETCFLLLLLLLAKGYTITRGRLPVAASIKLTIFMCTYIITYISIFIYESKVFDPGEILYLFESPAGYGLIILRILAWCMFVYSTVFTLKHFPEKSNFYYPFNICGTLWFVAGPAFILSANTYIDKWVRESVVCAVLLFIAFGGHLSFLILTTPSVANKNFPYHVRTTQIGVMEINGNDGGINGVQQFSHHMYEPSSTIAEQTVIIPLTRRTEEIFEAMYNQRTYTGPNQNNQGPVDVPQDLMMENVLNWSLAKNIPAMALPPIGSIRRNSDLDSNNSDEDHNLPSRKPSIITQQGTPNGNFHDYVKDVPVELFTISKMVLSTNNVNKNSQPP